MKCEKCGSSIWADDDLHWHWCQNPKCINFYGADNERMRDYFQAIREKEEWDKSLE